jgi:ribonuclease Z
MDMELYFLGTGAGLPSKQRNVTSIALQLLQERACTWLFDCGEGTQHQVLRAPVKLNQIEKIWITHLHGDHLFGLPGMLGSRSFHGGTTALHIYGPPGLREFVDVVLKVSQTHLTYPYHVHEIGEGVVFEDGQFRVEARCLSHGILSFGYRVTEKDTPGKLQVERLQAQGIAPGPVYGQLKRGETVRLENGELICGANYLTPPRRGRIVTVLGDTKKCDAAVELARNADVLVHEATFSADKSDLAAEYNHSTAENAADVSRLAGARSLILTHISSRYQAAETHQLLQEAQSIFPAAVLAEDFYCHEVKRTVEV